MEENMFLKALAVFFAVIMLMLAGEARAEALSKPVNPPVVSVRTDVGEDSVVKAVETFDGRTVRTSFSGTDTAGNNVFCEEVDNLW